MIDIARFLIQRIIAGALVLLFVAAGTFVLMHAVPGGPFDQERQLPPEILANVNAAYHLDEPVHIQFVRYMGNLARGDLGPSLKYRNRRVTDILSDAFPVSMRLGLMAAALIIVIAAPAGVLAALQQGRALDRGSVVIATLGISVPSFVLGAVLVWLFAHHWQLLPPALWEGREFMILPAVTLAAGPVAFLLRLTRSSVLDVLDMPFVRTAHAKGLRPTTVVLRHILIAALSPIVTYFGPLLAMLITGSFVVEFIFSIPGMGRFIIQAVNNRDYPLIMGTTLLYAALIVVAHIGVDLAYRALDPRVRLGGGDHTAGART